MARLVDADPVGEAELPSTLPAIEEQIVEWQVPIKASSHLSCELVVQLLKLTLDPVRSLRAHRRRQ